MPLELRQLRIRQLNAWLDNNHLTLEQLLELINDGDEYESH